jgi:hypothetical protein
MKRFYGVLASFIVAASLAATHTSIVLAQGIRAGVEAAHGTGQPTDLFGTGGIFTTIVNLLLCIIGAIAVVMIIVGGLRYVLSGGDASAVTTAKNTILYAVVGIIVAILAYAVVNFVVTNFSAGGAAGL